MKAKEFIPATKPRNFVAKNQKTAGAGAHRDKKRDEKQGNVKHKRDLMPMEAGWKDEAEDVGEWTDYVKERLTKASPEQRLSLAKKLSQVEVKNFGSSLGGGFDRNTGKAKTGELTDTVRSALRSISAGRSSDGDGPAGNFSMPFGSVDIQGMENATPEELAVMKKAVMMGPQVAGAAAKLYRKNGTITSQDLKGIESDFEKASGIEFGKPMYSSPEAKSSRERAMAGEGMEGGVDAKGRTQQQWLKLVKAKFPTARIMQARMIDGPITATLDDGRKLSWKKVEQPGAKPTQQSRWQVADKVAEGAEQMTPNWAKYVLDQIYNSNGEVTLTDLFDEGIPGLYDMFMDTAKQHGLDPEEDFEDVQHELTVELEDLIKGDNDLEEGLNELSSNLLGRYKKAAGDQATAADKAGDYDKGHKRFKGIVKATNKQFDNDAKKRK